MSDERKSLVPYVGVFCLLPPACCFLPSACSSHRTAIKRKAGQKRAIPVMKHQKPVRHACDRHEAGNHQSASAYRDASRKKVSQGWQKPAIDRHGCPSRKDGASKDLEEKGYKVIGARSEK